MTDITSSGLPQDSETPLDDAAIQDSKPSQSFQGVENIEAVGTEDKLAALQGDDGSVLVDSSDDGLVPCPQETQVQTSFASQEQGHMPDDELLSLAASRRNKRRWPKVVLVVAAAIVVVLGCAVGALAYDDSQRTQKVPQGTVLDGTVDISGMTADQLSQTISARLENGLATQVTVHASDQSFAINAADVGTVDLEATITEAFAPYDENFFQRCYDRIVDLTGSEQHDYEVTTVTNVDSELLNAKVAEIAEAVNVDAKDAGYEYADGGLVTTEAVQGVALDTDATASLVNEALQGTTGSLDVDAVTSVTEPESTDPGKAIYVNTSSCKLYLYDEGEVTFSCLCSPGRSGYATPTGDFYLEYKVKNPTWTNPGSDWAKNMPETIGPGESNPMGLRKLALSCGGGIFIHGTTNTGALGSRDSHGCIRISNANVVELYDLVEVGTPIIVRS